MRYRALDTNLLVLLDILLDTLSITKTAEVLGLTQPAVSLALGRLREHFADNLIVQVGRSNVATPLANQLRGPLKDLLARTDALIALRAGFDPETHTRCFSFIGSDYVAAIIGNEVMRTVARSGPHLSAKLELLSPGSIDDFDRGQIDAVITPSQIAYPDHPTMELFDERFVCAVWNEHPTIGDTLSAEQYLAARHVIHDAKGGARLPILDQWFLDKSSMTRDVAIQVPSFAHILPIVPGTPFVATVQFQLARKMAQTLPIRILPAPFEFPALKMVMQWHRHLDDDEGVTWFRAKVAEIITGLGLKSPPDDPHKQ
jgi:DNA-binding transcriptional LysR family regulator